MSILDKASLIQIPSGYKSTKLYSLRPSNGDGDFTFARSSSATRVNSEGLIEDVPYNLLEQSNTFNTTWSTTRASLTSGESGYDGSSNAWAMVDNTINSTHLLVQNFTIIEGEATFSIYAKAGAVDFIVFRFEGATVDYAYFNLSNGTIGTVDANYTNVNITDVGNGWYKCEATNESVNKAVILTAQSDNDPTYAGTGTTAIYIQDAQVVKGSTAKTYFPTTDRLNVPRLDYSGGASCASLLLEPQRSNLVLHSNDLTQSIWTKSNVSAVSESDGIYNDKNKITINTANDRHIVYQAISKTSTNDAFSVYVKKGNTSLVFIQAATSNASSRRGVIFNFDSGVVVNDSIGGSAASYSVDACANGWFRISLKGGLSTTVYPLVGFTNSQNPTLNASYEPIFIGNGTDFFYASAFQYEVGAYKTSYIPTTTAAVTRTADVCNNAGTSATFNDSEGVLFAEIAALAEDSTNRYMSLSDGTPTNRVNIFFNSGNKLRGFVSGTSSIEGNVDIKSFNKCAYRYKSGENAFFINGVKVGEDTATISLSGLNEVAFDRWDGGDDFYGKTKQLMVFNEALSDEELSDLTGQVNLSFNNLATFYNYTIL